MTPNALNMDCISNSKTLLKSLQKHCQTVFSRFLSMTIFIPAENTRQSEKPGQNPGVLSFFFSSVAFETKHRRLRPRTDQTKSEIHITFCIP
jgi:hypothetical protein